MSTPLQHGYIGLSGSVSSKTSSEKSSERCNNGGLNLKATELRLGLPGSESLERGDGLEERTGYSLPLQKSFVSGAKRGFSDAIDGASAKWVFAGNGGSELDLAKVGNLFAARSVNDCKNQQTTSAGKNGVSPSPKSLPEKNSQLSSPAAKEQVVGWPPIRSFRKNSMVSSSKNDDNPEEKAGSASLYVKVSMDGAPYLRKIDLKAFNCYRDLSSTLGKMFSGFTIAFGNQKSSAFIKDPMIAMSLPRGLPLGIIPLGEHCRRHPLQICSSLTALRASHVTPSRSSFRHKSCLEKIVGHLQQKFAHR